MSGKLQIKYLTKNIYDEIINNEGLGKVLIDNGFINYFKSLLSNYHYIYNQINTIIETYLSKVNQILMLIKKIFNNYVSQNIHLMTNAYMLFQKKSDEEQQAMWNRLSYFYDKKKEEINKIKLNLGK